MKSYYEQSHKSMHAKLSRFGVAGHTKDNPHPDKHVNSLVGGMNKPAEGTREMDGGVHGRKCYKRGGRVKRDTGGNVEDPVANDSAEERLDSINNKLARGGAAKKDMKKDCYASGGGVKSKGKKGTTVNVVIESPPAAASPQAAPLMPPAMPPPMPPPPPPGPPMGAGAMPPGMPPPMPGRPPMPPMRASGGRVHMEAGSASGEGRLEKTRMAKRGVKAP